MENLKNTSKVEDYKESIVDPVDEKDTYIQLKEYQIPDLVAIETGDFLDQQSRDIADKNLDKDQEYLKKSGIKGFIKNIWKYNITKEYTRQLEIDKARKSLLLSGNFYKGEDSNLSDEDISKSQKEAMNALIERFAYEDESGKTLEHTYSGEERKKIDLGDFKDTLGSYIKGEITLDDFKYFKTIFLTSKEVYGEKYEDNQLKYFDNILEVADNLKVKFDQEKLLRNIDNLELELTQILEKKLNKIIIAREAKLGVRTEAQYTNSDKVIEFLKKTPVGNLVDSSVISTAVGIASSTIGSFAQSITKSFAVGAGIVGAGALVSGGISAMREGHKVSNERRQHNREMAKGGEIESGSKKREDLERYRYETVSANQLIELIKNYLDKDFVDDDDIEVEKLLSQIESKILVSDSKKIDLISYSRFDQVEQERTQLDINRAKLNLKLKKFKAEKTKAVESERLDYEQKLESAKELLLDNQKVKDRLFNKMRSGKMQGAFVKGALTSVVAGTVFQEAKAVFDSNTDGLVENLIKKSKLEGSLITPLEKIGSFITNRLEDTKSFVENIIPRKILLEKTEISISSDKYNIVDWDRDGIYNIIDEKGDIVYPDIPIKFESDGSFSEEIIRKLEDKGINISQEVVPIGSGENIQKVISIDEFVEQNKGVNVDYIDYATNNTDFADGNELGLDYGLNEKGEVVLKFNMIENGSITPSGESINVIDEMSKGNVKVAFYADSDLSKKALVLMEVDRNGDIIVPEYIRNNFFDREGEFIGGRMQVFVDKDNIDTSDLESIAIAGLEGKGITEAKIDVVDIDYITKVSFGFTEDGNVVENLEDTTNKTIEAPFNIPIYDILKDDKRLESIKERNSNQSGLGTTQIASGINTVVTEKASVLTVNPEISQVEVTSMEVENEDKENISVESISSGTNLESQYNSLEASVSEEVKESPEKSELDKFNDLLNEEIPSMNLFPQYEKNTILDEINLSNESTDNINLFSNLNSEIPINNDIKNLEINQDEIMKDVYASKLIEFGYEAKIIREYNIETIKNTLDLENMLKNKKNFSIENISKIINKYASVQKCFQTESRKFLFSPVGLSLEDKLNLADRVLNVSKTYKSIDIKFKSYIKEIAKSDNLEISVDEEKNGIEEVKSFISYLTKLHQLIYDVFGKNQKLIEALISVNSNHEDIPAEQEFRFDLYKTLDKIENKYYDYFMSFMKELEIYILDIYKLKSKLEVNTNISEEDKNSVKEISDRIIVMKTKVEAMQSQEGVYSIKSKNITLDENKKGVLTINIMASIQQVMGDINIILK